MLIRDIIDHLISQNAEYGKYSINSFTFRETNSDKVIKLTKTLNINKAFQNTDIPTKIIKSNAGLFASYIFRNELPYVLKHADVVPVYKKKK